MLWGAEKQALALASAVGIEATVTRVHNVLHRLPTPLQLGAMRLLGADALGLLKTTRRGCGSDGGSSGVAVRSSAGCPILAISCGRASVPASIALRRQSEGHTLTVNVQRPPCDPTLFDLVVAPRHDYVQESPPPNVLLTDG